jgi:arabinogalactan endo-1,4-beta-galactosidase
MFLGMDPSSYLEELEKKPRYYVKGKEVEPLSYMHDNNNVSSLRLRLWLNPFSEKGEPYHGGTNDWKSFVKLAHLGMSKGYSILLDLHYSDFWCDPSKQTLPKSWKNLSLQEVGEEVYEYTKGVVINCKKEGIKLKALQIGNEITNGMLWPLGKIDWDPVNKKRIGWENLSFLLSKASKGAREADSNLPLIVHLERSGDKDLHEEYYREIINRGVDFDIIGLSYYPYWHGTFDMLFANIDNLKAKFHKPVWIVETGYGFTMAPFISNANDGANLISEKFFEAKDVYKPYPLTMDGQKEFVEELIRLSILHDVKAIYYWEPLWLPLPGIEWASIAGEEYIHETNKPTHNEWANQCLFDYDGHATPAFFSYKI